LVAAASRIDRGESERLWIHTNQRSRIADDRDQAESEIGMRFDLGVK
jgi:hypothetical protein